MSLEGSNELSDLARALANLDEERVQTSLDRCFEQNVPAHVIIEELSAGMNAVGRRYKEGDYYLAELVFSGELFSSAMARVKPLLENETESRARGRVVLGTVKDDIHDLGKNIVRTLLECSGFQVIDLGVDVPPEKFIEAIRDSGALLVGMSVLLTTAFPSMQRTLDAISEAGLRERVRIMIGGAVTNEKIREQMGADYHGKDASVAVEIAEQVFGSLD